jgi:hypothetical protein
MSPITEINHEYKLVAISVRQVTAKTFFHIVYDLKIHFIPFFYFRSLAHELFADDSNFLNPLQVALSYF